MRNKCYPDFDKVPNFIFEEINGLLRWDKYNPRLLRTYIYSGEYSKPLQDIIKIKLKKLNKNYREINDFLSKIINERKIQKECFQKLYLCKFVELKLKPLQFSDKEMRVFQKGTDVQLAVDLVHHAYQDNFDVAVVCSGDVDLLESIKLVKNQGKKVIIVAHPNDIARDMRKECDFFFNLAKINEKLENISFQI